MSHSLVKKKWVWGGPAAGGSFEREKKSRKWALKKSKRAEGNIGAVFFCFQFGKNISGKRKKATVQECSCALLASLFFFSCPSYFTGALHSRVLKPAASMLLLAGTRLLAVVRRVRGGNRDGDVVSRRRRIIVPFTPYLLL